MPRYRTLCHLVKFAVLSLAFSTLVQACELKVRVSIFEPLAMRDHQGHWTGIDIDHAKALLDLAKCRYTFVEMPFARGLHMLSIGELDMMLEVSKFPQREKNLYFIGPQRQEIIHLVSKKGATAPITRWQQLESLDLVILRQRGTYVGERFEQVLQKNAQLRKRMILLGATGVRIDMVKKGRADGFFAERAYLQHRIRTNPDYSMIELHPLVIHNAPVYYAFSKVSVSKALLKRLRLAYQQLAKTTKLRDIEAHYSQAK